MAINSPRHCLSEVLEKHRYPTEERALTATKTNMSAITMLITILSTTYYFGNAHVKYVTGVTY